MPQGGESISIRKIAPTTHRSLEERLVAFYGKLIETIVNVALNSRSGSYIIEAQITQLILPVLRLCPKNSARATARTRIIEPTVQ